MRGRGRRSFIDSLLGYPSMGYLRRSRVFQTDCCTGSPGRLSLKELTRLFGEINRAPYILYQEESPLSKFLRPKRAKVNTAFPDACQSNFLLITEAPVKTDAKLFEL